MNEDPRKSTEGVIAGMLRSLEGTQQEDEASVVLEHERVPVASEKDNTDDVLEIAGDFNYDGYQVVRREFLPISVNLP